MPAHPVIQFNRWYAAARRAHEAQADGMALATAGRAGRPAVRYVLLKGADESGFTFYTNLGSPKARALTANPRAALAFYWHKAGRQVRITGRIRPVSGTEADAYWVTRPRQSQLGGWASAQSRPIASRARLVARAARLAFKFRGRPVPRPANWSGFRLIPATIEFWTRGLFRLHDRILWQRTRRGWRATRLQP